MPLIYVDPNNLNITVHSSIDDVYTPTENTIAIKKFAESIKIDKEKYLIDVYNPMVDKLMEMVMQYNSQHNPEIAKKWEAIKKERAAKEKRQTKVDKSVDPVIKVSTVEPPKKSPLKKNIKKKNSKTKRK